MTDNELIIQYHAGHKEAISNLIKNFEPYMERLAYRWRITAAKVGLDEDDLQQEGWIAFVNLVEKMNTTTCTCSFSTYAYGAVEFAIRNAIVHNRPRGYKTTKDKNDISICSIYQNVFPGEETSEMLIDSIASTSFPSTDYFIEQEYKNNLKRDLTLLLDTVLGCHVSEVNKTIAITNEFLIQRFKSTPNAEYVILLNYGIYGEPMSFTEIGKQTGYSVSVISNMELTAFRKIRYSYIGRQFLKLYAPTLLERLDDLRLQREAAYTYFNPEKAVIRLEEIDSRINKYLNL